MALIPLVNSFTYTDAIHKMRKLRKRIKVIPGGSSAGKTYGILPILIDRATKTPGLEISVVSESMPHLKKGALRDFKKIMKATGRWCEAHFHKTDSIYTFANGSFIEFFGADDQSKVTGPRRNILYINECNNITYEVYHQLAIRTNLEVWLDFNPTHEFWVHEELQDDPDTDWLTLTYKDNGALDASIVRELEKGKYKAFIDPELPPDLLFHHTNVKSGYWANWWKVYGLGMLGVLQGAVFTNWETIDTLPAEARLIGYAIDFGYTNDPSALIGCYLYNGTIIWDEVFYLKGLKNSDIARLMKAEGVRANGFVVADSAEPKSIDEINAYGFKVRPADKGKDSIMFGIDIMQQKKFLVTKRSVNIINELRKYCWDTDKSGKSLNVPIDAFNHTIDCMRYIAIMRLAKSKAKKKGPRRRN